MKTYCKPKTVDIESLTFNSVPVHRAFADKLNKRMFRNLLLKTGRITPEEYAQERKEQRFNKTIEAIDAVAEDLTERIRKRDLQIPPIRKFQRLDGLSQKLRDLNQESAVQQVYEYIAVEALMPLFKAKLLPCQYGSIPGGGQTAGKRHIERLLRRKFHCKIDEIKGDVRHAYQSVTTECVMKLLRRDIGKNKPLLWFIEALMANYTDGRLMIGGYLPTWLFNYVMSYVLRHLLELHKLRRGVRHNMVWACVCYADDFALFGRRSNLMRAIKETARWSKKTLGLEIKPAWDINYPASFEEEKSLKQERRVSGTRKRTPGIDMVGFVVRRTYTIIRGRIFVRIRRQFLRARRELDTMGYVPWWRAYKIVSYYGWLVNSDSQTFRKNYQTKRIMKAAKKSVSWRGRHQMIREAIQNERNLCAQA